MVSSTGSPAGTMIQTTRGASSFFTTSARDVAPVAPSLAYRCTDSAVWAYATTPCPPRSRRSVMLPPILPNPIIASCIGSLWSHENGARRRAVESLEPQWQTRERVRARRDLGKVESFHDHDTPFQQRAMRAMVP